MSDLPKCWDPIRSTNGSVEFELEKIEGWKWHPDLGFHDKCGWSEYHDLDQPVYRWKDAPG